MGRWGEERSTCKQTNLLLNQPLRLFYIHTMRILSFHLPNSSLVFPKLNIPNLNSFHVLHGPLTRVHPNQAFFYRLPKPKASVSFNSNIQALCSIPVPHSPWRWAYLLWNRGDHSEPLTLSFILSLPPSSYTSKAAQNLFLPPAWNIPCTIMSDV